MRDARSKSAIERLKKQLAMAEAGAEELRQEVHAPPSPSPPYPPTCDTWHASAYNLLLRRTLHTLRI